jgi:hypothetical protein
LRGAELRELAGERWADVADHDLRGLGRRGDARPGALHGGIDTAAEDGSGVGGSKWRLFNSRQSRGLLDFDGMGIKFDVERERKSWAATFTSVQTALRFCNLDHVEAGKTVRKFIDADILEGERALIGRKASNTLSQSSQ